MPEEARRRTRPTENRRRTLGRMAPDSEREKLAATFDTAASTYATARPTYPPALFDDLVAATGIRPGAHLLEVGSGPGIATAPLADRGFRITCLEPGPA